MNQKYRQGAVLTIIVLFFLINASTFIYAANGIVKAKETHQTMIGFGASIAWANDQLTTHPNKGEIYMLFTSNKLKFFQQSNTII